MDLVDFKIQTLCDISFFNEEGDRLFSANNSLSLPDPIELNDDLELTTKSKSMLEKYGQEKFASLFLKVIKDLEMWIKEKYYLFWEEDDVNFLNFMLRSKYIYSSKIEGTYINIQRELFSKCLTPFIMNTTKKDVFFEDVSYWFITIGEKLYRQYSLLEQLDFVIDHFEKEHLSISKKK